MKTTLTRRKFLRRAALAAAGVWAAPALIRSARAVGPSETLRHASFGTTGMAAADIESLTRHPALKLVAVADVDLNHAGTIKKKFPDVKIYQDWRELLDKEKSIDSVNVTVPDHMHARHRHVRPAIGQTRLLPKAAHARPLRGAAPDGSLRASEKLVTQMGIQIHSAGAISRPCCIIQQGAIGKIKEVHSWSDKKWGDPAAAPDTRPIPCQPVSTGIDGWASRPRARSSATAIITRPIGASGSTSAPAPSATWAATFLILSSSAPADRADLRPFRGSRAQRSGTGPSTPSSITSFPARLTRPRRPST